MRKCPLLLLSAVEALLVLAAVYFEPTYRVRGTLWGEAFFEGKPTSFWRQELERWHVLQMDLGRHDLEWCGSMRRFRVPIFMRESTWMETQLERLRPAVDSLDDGRIVHISRNWHGPSILNGGDDAKAVLVALLDDPSPRVRRFARYGLGAYLEFDEDD